MSTQDIIDAIKDSVTNGGSSSGSSGGGGGYSVDQSAKIQYKQQLAQVYLRLWGIAPPPGYIDRAAKAHMNFYEFEAHERAKPAFKNSQTYHEERISVEGSIAQRLGALG